MEPQQAGRNAEPLGSLHEAVELVEHANASAAKRGQRGTRYTQTRKRAEAENEARVKDQVEDVGYPKKTHGDGRIAGAAENGVVKKEHDDGAASAKRNAGVPRAGRDNFP